MKENKQKQKARVEGNAGHPAGHTRIKRSTVEENASVDVVAVVVCS